MAGNRATEHPRSCQRGNRAQKNTPEPILRSKTPFVRPGGSILKISSCVEFSQEMGVFDLVHARGTALVETSKRQMAIVFTNQQAWTEATKGRQNRPRQDQSLDQASTTASLIICQLLTLRALDTCLCFQMHVFACPRPCGDLCPPWLRPTRVGTWVGT